MNKEKIYGDIYRASYNNTLIAGFLTNLIVFLMRAKRHKKNNGFAKSPEFFN